VILTEEFGDICHIKYFTVFIQHSGQSQGNQTYTQFYV